MKTIKITFDKKSVSFVLDALGYKISVNGFVLDETGLAIHDIDGMMFKVSDIVGIINNKFYTRESQLLSERNKH